MRLIVASEDSGSIKEVVANRGTDTSKPTALQPLHLQSHLPQGLSNHVETIWKVNPSQLLVGRSSGVIELVGLEEREKELKEEGIPNFNINTFMVQDSLVGCFSLEKQEEFSKKSQKRSKFVDGFVGIFPLPKKEGFYIAVTRSGLLYIFEKLKAKLRKLHTHELVGPLEFIQIHDLAENYDSYVFAYGGEDNLVKLVEISNDLSSIRQIWMAKNVKNDRIDLTVPIWPIGLRFLENNAKNVNDDSLNYQFVTVTRHAHFRFYQTSHGRKPLKSLNLLGNKEQLTSINLIGDVTALGNVRSKNYTGFSFVTTDARKNVYQFDLKGHLLGKFGNGDITGHSSFIGVHNQKYLLQGGLDRYVRIFDLHTRRILVKAFTGGKIKNVMLLDDGDIELPQAKTKNNKRIYKRKQSAEEEEKEADDLWSKLDAKKKKRHN
ncbi:ribosome biosynthesis protein NSA1 Ecym_2273 [Eremothecium cymbalariae DBVPG|uniref:Ribosome biogenesis protein NSA1 n=1 Tax=Eremothecium cymbalariae (strain CBS 270.75 / DBVPG 7215 / KCTC 17166 / NRRL Y-17582) TaxID=931890 RepID=G8JPR4_ERECY|nr:Hypothetical protein Ecym_2273 [Eremothecium cymbalariae DBVPG\